MFFQLFLDSKSDPDDNEIYLEPEYDQLSGITIHIEAIAEELLNIAKKSVRQRMKFSHFYSVEIIRTKE